MRTALLGRAGAAAEAMMGSGMVLVVVVVVFGTEDEAVEEHGGGYNERRGGNRRTRVAEQTGVNQHEERDARTPRRGANLFMQRGSKAWWETGGGWAEDRSAPAAALSSALQGPA